MKLKEHKKKFFNSGFIIIRNIFKKEQIKEILNELELIKKKVIKKKIRQFYHETKDGNINTIHDIQKIHKQGYLKKISKNSKIIKIAKAILEDDPIIRNMEFFLKPKLTGLASPFHQDNFYWNIEDAKALNVWIACTKSNKKNGGVVYLSGSNKLGTLNHKLSYAKGSSQKIEDFVLKNLNFKKIFPNLNVGDCVFHHPNVIHGSMNNKSSFDRIGFVISYKAKKAKIDKKKIKLYQKNIIKNLSKIYN